MAKAAKTTASKPTKSVELKPTVQSNETATASKTPEEKPNDSPAGGQPGATGDTDKESKQPAEKGKSADDKVTAAPKLADKLKPYVKAYPNEKAFHVTSDDQVFLERDLRLAKEHQKGLDKNKEVQTLIVKP